MRYQKLTSKVDAKKKKKPNLSISTRTPVKNRGGSTVGSRLFAASPQASPPTSSGYSSAALYEEHFKQYLAAVCHTSKRLAKVSPPHIKSST